MKGKAGQLASGTVVPGAPADERDRAKAIVDWAAAGLSHQRVGRITVRTDEGE
jgi:hypothetical protein